MCIRTVPRLSSITLVGESYITHIRVQEDAAYPSNPPPPTSPSENKKPRVIIISVRNTGRVRMHKARENSNSTFSIGKTWNLEELTAVESFAGNAPASTDDTRRRQWAGPVGFIVTIAKPYYWQAGTAKEKEFFIGSLVKIYRKYTQGRTPQLVGFGAEEQEQMLGSIGQPAKGQRPPPASESSRTTPGPITSPAPDNGPSASSGEANKRQGRPTPGSRVPSGSDERQTYQAYHQSPSEQVQRPAPLHSQQGQSPGLQPRAMASQERIIRQAPSREQVRPPPSPGRALGQRLTPEFSRSEPGGQRSVSPEESSISSKQPSNEPIPIPAQSPQRQFNRRQNQNNEETIGEARTPNGTNVFMSAVDRFKSSGTQGDEKTSPMSNRRPPFTQNNSSKISIPGREGGISESEERKVPERKRPPIVAGRSDGGRSQLGDKSVGSFATPTSSPLDRKDVASEGGSQESKVEDAGVPGTRLRPAPLGLTGRTSSDPLAKPSAATSRAISNGSATPTGETSTQESPSSAPDTPVPETPGEEESFRPGLGPMIKKKERRDAATFFRKAAAAHNAFKPRTGGAVNKFPTNGVKSPDEPDGISAVVPAPSLARTLSSPSEISVVEKPGTESPSTPQPQEEVSEQVPELKISSPDKPTASEADRSPAEVAPSEAEQNLQRPSINSRAESTESLPPEFRRRNRRSMQHNKYLTMLNVDSNLLEGKGLNFEAALGDFGWGNNLLQSQKLEAMEADVRRELGRVEAGSWLGHLEQKDDRVETVEKMLDKAIAECEEFEGLLTLYGVELSVSIVQNASTLTMTANTFVEPK